MKIYEEVARLEVKEAIQNGVSAQNRKRMLKANNPQPELTAEKRDELFRTLFSEERRPDNLERKPRLLRAGLYCFIAWIGPGGHGRRSGVVVALEPGLSELSGFPFTRILPETVYILLLVSLGRERQYMELS